MTYDCTNRKPYPKYPHYLVAKDGTVWRTEFRNNRVIKTFDCPRICKTRLRSGYPSVGLWENGIRKSHSVHVMVLETFVGPRPGSNFQSAHLNGNPLDPRLENLQWTTAVTNNSHKRLHGTMPYGRKSGAAKLSDQIVLEIKAARKDGVLTHLLAAKYGVAHTTIRRAISGERWAHLKAAGVEV